MATLRYLLSDSAYPVKRLILTYLRPWDIAKLCHILQFTLSDEEQRMYLNILDDIFEDRSILTIAGSRNIGVYAFGTSLNILKGRLCDTEGYFQTYGEAKEIQHSPIFVFFRGTLGDPHFPNNRLVYELSEDQREENVSGEDKFLGKWMRVEPLCSQNFYHYTRRWQSNTVDPKWIFQNEFWSNPYANRHTIPSVFKSAHWMNDHIPAISYISTGLCINLLSVNVPQELLKHAMSIKDGSFIIYAGKVIGDELQISETSGKLPSRGMKHKRYPQIYDEGAVVSFELEEDMYLDILLPGTIISVW